jgi:peptidoglycan/LPS O-acetylase OafA/YrhL
MMIGALGAILYKQNNKLFLRLTDNKLVQAVCWIIIFLVAINKFHFASVIDNEIISVVALAIIIGQVRVRNRIINLEVNIMDFLGKISYGIYVIHPILIYFIGKFLGSLNIESPYKYIIVYFTVLGATILVAYLSYTYFEKYFLNFKKKFVVVNSSATKNFDEEPQSKTVVAA